MSTDPRIGTVMAGCRIEARLGPGGMSEVYLAEHLHLERKVALKLLDPRLAEDQDYRQRFLRESRLAASLYHPNIVPIYDAGEADGVPYLMMHFVRGSDLGDLIRGESPLDPERVVTIISQVVSALDAAHDHGLVHRDVKPPNILIASGEAEPAGHVYLTDFGLAKQVQSGTRLTRQGLFMGTLDYVAPEQIQGQAVDRRTDVYSLGCVVYECLTGSVPFPREPEVARMYAHMQEDPPPVTGRRPDLPAAVDPVVARAMAKAMGDRYPTCAAFLEELEEGLHAVPETVEAQPADVPQEPVPAPGSGVATPAPVPEEAPAAPPLADVLFMDYRGVSYGLGRTPNGYAIWDLRTGGRPIRLFPQSSVAWEVAWTTFQELESEPALEPAPPGSGEQPVPEQDPPTGEQLLVGVVFLDYRGSKYALGRSTDSYAIWDLQAGGYPVQTFPQDPRSWQGAWQRYQELETTPAAVAAGQGEAPWDGGERAAGAPAAAQPAELAAAVAVDYRGAGYGLGRTSDAYAIWDLAAGGNPVRTFPLHPASWNEAWGAFQELEAGLQSG